MPLGLVARLRPHLRPIAMIAAGLIALQAFLAGLASTQAVAIAAPDFIDFAVICHGTGGTDPGDGTAPDPINIVHLCCVACMASAPPATLSEQAVLPQSDRCRESTTPAVCAAAVPIAGRAVRAGLSQAPPLRG